MKIEQLREIANAPTLLLNWSRTKGYVFVIPSSERDDDYEVVVPNVWPKNYEVNLSMKWAVYMAQKGDEAFGEISGTPLMKYSFALSRLAGEIETLILNVTSFVKAHEGLTQKEFADLVVHNDHIARIMQEDRSIKSILFDARNRTPREAVFYFYETRASGYFYP